VADTVTRADGKTYPQVSGFPGRPDPAGTLQAIKLAHTLCHSGRLTVRGTQAAMRAFGVRRSIGSVHHYLADYECGVCRGWPAAQPEPVQEPEREPEWAHARRWGESRG
jgi:hypothetical protein